MIVAIDGPAGAGKSTVARALARELGFTYLDSGAMYRTVALESLEHPERAPAEIAGALDVALGERVLLGARDVTDEIRTPQVSVRASEVAADPAVRSALVERQRALMRTGDWVAEGRDIGTVVAPDAAVKVFLDASEQARAQRRALETGDSRVAVLEAQRARDRRDRERTHSPLAPAPGAIVIDTTSLALEEVVARIGALVAARRLDR